MWEEVKDAIRVYYGNDYKPDRAFNKLNDLKQTGTVQKYLYGINRLNVYIKMTDYYLINIILNGMTPRLQQAVTHYEDPRSDPHQWKEKLLHMDFIITEFQNKQPSNRSKGQGKKRSLEERVQLKGGEVGSEKKKGEFVPK